MTLHCTISKRGERTPMSINRIGGFAIGVSPKKWPTIYNPETDQTQPMTHVLTVDARELGLPVPRNVAALALFVSSPECPMYFDDPTSDYTVLALTDGDIAIGEVDGPMLPGPMLDAHPMTLTPVGSDQSVGRSYTGGQPRYIQSESNGPERDFVLQFDESLIPINLGDSGVLYMFTGWAMWECY